MCPPISIPSTLLQSKIEQYDSANGENTVFK